MDLASREFGDEFGGSSVGDSITLRRSCLAAARAWSAWVWANQAAWGRQLLSRPNTTTFADASVLGLVTDFWVMTFSGI
jgi:hypothetical protein